MKNTKVSLQELNRELNIAVLVAVMMSVSISFILIGLYISYNFHDLPRRVCVDNISSEVIQIEFRIGHSTRILEKSKVINYTCTEGMEVYDDGNILFFEYPISKLSHLPISDIKPETCIVKINNRVCEIK
jgi:hypothetical protein